MKCDVVSSKPQTNRADTIVLFTSSLSKIQEKPLKDLDAASRGALSILVQSKEFSGKEGEFAQIVAPSGYAARRIIVAGLGESRKITADTIRRTFGLLSRNKGITSSTSVACSLGNHCTTDNIQAAVEGFLLGGHKILTWRSGEGAKNSSKTERLSFLLDGNRSPKKFAQAVGVGQITAEGQILVRELAATPSNDLTPRIYVDRITQLIKGHKIRMKVLDEIQIAQEKMGGLIGVAKGSVEPPRFVILEYNGAAASQKPIVLVGKGVTFDTGGISLKQAADMHEMKADMTGSAVVIATIIAASRLKLPLNIVTLTPLTENMPSGTATKPGDVLTMRNGMTVEIINTDAEGRLVLADALDYASKFKPQVVIDIATLTGAALFILGYAGAPVLGNNRQVMNRLRSAADATSERVWELPIWDDHRDQMKGSIADLVNSGGRAAGTIAATAFLENFVGDWPWAHVDIAYVDMEPKGRPYVPKGNTGIGLRLFVQMLRDWKKL
ncbi:MAG: leucyl aminopeptidase [Candidatus Zixiibacteriota bacterium]